MRTVRFLLLIFAALAIETSGLLAQNEANNPDEPAREEGRDGAKGVPKGEAPRIDSSFLSALRFRSIGPALAEGRIGDFAVDPEHRERFFAAVASGGVWYTENAGVTWKPVFDSQGSYSIGCVTLDPNDPNTVWVGTGENNAQRSVGFGDGVYKSTDGGKSWRKMGLPDSEHIGRIVVDPRDSNVVFVAAQGPLWRDGGDRGLYKTTDGGLTWRRVLHVDEKTGANEVWIDPRDPDVLYCSTWQRRRRVWTLIDGGPGSAIYKSTDGGESWRKLRRGLPGGDLGRIGLAVSPADPDVVYAIIELPEGKGGIWRSTDRGESWEKRSDTTTSSPQYYNELVPDPRDPDVLYVLDTLLRVSRDGGKTFTNVPSTNRHVDHHALWIDPNDPHYLLAGTDGGVYESHDGGKTWSTRANLPITQFYRVSVDDRRPFYFVYGGTQDNNSFGGPSRTISRAGIANEDWFVTVGGDGYETLADPEIPDILYSLWQYGGLVRYDHRSGEVFDIRPREAPGEEPLRWNWDTPLVLSPHHPSRLYVAAQRIFRSDDRGDSWTPISPDLTRRVDRDQLEVMGELWPPEAVAKNRSTSFYGSIVSLNESPLVEGLLYAGTDDGLIQVTEDGGEHWRRIDSVPGVPKWTYVSRLEASRHRADRVYAAFDAHKDGDFRPYVYRSDDRGRTWLSIRGDLPDREVVYALAEDPVDENILFAGTEFGCYVTLDGGEHWHRLRSGLPTIQVRDLVVQERFCDLVLGTFGRSFYVLDDYSPLRHLNEEALASSDAILFPIRDAFHYVPRSRLGGHDGKGSQGASFFTAPNPAFGATFTYYLREGRETLKERRRREWREAKKRGEKPRYPTLEELRAEELEIKPSLWLVIRDAEGEVVRRLEAGLSKGLHRATWNLQIAPATPVPEKGDGGDGPLCLPGRYTVTLLESREDAVRPLAGPVPFDVVPLDLAVLKARDPADAYAFRLEVRRLRRATDAASRALRDARAVVDRCRNAVRRTPGADPGLLSQVADLRRRLLDLDRRLSGDRTASRHQQPKPPSIRDRVSALVGNQWRTTQAPTKTERDQLRWASEEFAPVYEELRRIVEREIPRLLEQLDEAGAGYIPPRLPHWSPGRR